MGTLKDLIKDVAFKNQLVQTYAAKVIQINFEEKTDESQLLADAYTVNVMRSDGAIIKNVLLKASIQDKEEGIVVLPKLDSWVLVSVIDGVETRAFVSQFSEIDRAFLRIKRDKNQFLEVDATACNFSLLFKEKEENKGESAGSEVKPKYKKKAIVDFKEKDGCAKFTTVFFDENEKELSKSCFDAKQQQTVLNTLNGDTVKERINWTLSTEGNPKVNLQIKDADGKSKQNVLFDEEQAQIKFEEGYTSTISKDQAFFTKDELSFEMGKKFKVAAGGKNLKEELDSLITEITAITVSTPVGPSSTPMNAANFNTVKNNLSKILE